MDEAAIERLRIAVRVLNLRYDYGEKATETEIETLKSYIGGDVTNVPVEEIAASVIRRELKLELSDEDYGPTLRNGRGNPPPGDPDGPRNLGCG